MVGYIHFHYRVKATSGEWLCTPLEFGDVQKQFWRSATNNPTPVHIAKQKQNTQRKAVNIR